MMNLKNERSLQKSIEYNSVLLFFKSATANPYVVYGAQTQQNMIATPSSISSPGVYPITSHLPPQGTACPQTIDNNLSHPPPSYDSLTASSISHVYDTIQDSSKNAI